MPTLLYYLYGGKISEEEFKTHSKDLINAADKYGVTNSKLAAEVWFVHNTDITVENLSNGFHSEEQIGSAKIS